jgi:hypothetical protein
MAVSKDVKHLLIGIAAIWFGTLAVAGAGYGIYAIIRRDQEIADEQGRKYAELIIEHAKLEGMKSRAR